MKRFFLLPALLLALLLTACGAKSVQMEPGQLSVALEGDGAYSICVSTGGMTEVGQNADGSALDAGQALTFDDLCGALDYTVTVLDEDGAVLASCDLQDDFDAAGVLLVVTEDLTIQRQTEP